MTTIDWAALRPGDPRTWGFDGGPLCCADVPGHARDGRPCSYICSRSHGHDGPHVAVGITAVLATTADPDGLRPPSGTTPDGCPVWATGPGPLVMTLPDGWITVTAGAVVAGDPEQLIAALRAAHAWAIEHTGATS